MILFEIVLWLGVIGHTLLLLVCVGGSLIDRNGFPAEPPQDPGERGGSRGHRASDRLPVVWFPCHGRCAGASKGTWRRKATLGELLECYRSPSLPAWAVPSSGNGGKFG